MSILEEVLTAVAGIAGTLELYAPVQVAPAAGDNGLSIAVAGGEQLPADGCRSFRLELLCALNGRHSEPMTAADALGRVHLLLAQQESYPFTENWQIVDISTAAAPHFLKQEAEQWLYESTLRIKLFVKGV